MKIEPLPTFWQMAGLAVLAASRSMARLAQMRREDHAWDETDVDVELAVDLVASHIEQMRSADFSGHDDFTSAWLRALGTLSLANEAFSRKGHPYSRSLASTCRMFEQLAELLDLTQCPTLAASRSRSTEQPDHSGPCTSAPSHAC